MDRAPVIADNESTDRERGASLEKLEGLELLVVMMDQVEIR
jgi:hypothetical protein